MKQLLAVLLSVLMCAGCASPFLQPEAVDSLAYAPSAENRIIYYNKHYRFSSPGTLTITTHMLIKAGANSKAHPEFLYVSDGSIEKLVRYDARIVAAGGAELRYSMRDLNTLNLSNRYIVSDLNVRYLPIAGDLRGGDLIETVYEHETTLAELGIAFSLSELPLDGENISCDVEIPDHDTLLYSTLNDECAPAVRSADGMKTYSFVWKTYTAESGNYELGKHDPAPGFIASVPSSSARASAAASWRSFGAWYLGLVYDKLKGDDAVRALADSIAKGKETPKARLDAIFDYCRRTIRYEQVYVSRGEIIPRTCRAILKNKYGDCKDYSIAIYTLARSLGIDVRLALAYRGRGSEFKEAIPALQFNHMLIHYRENGDDRWYDGTNRTGAPGIVTADLINQTALVIDADSSRLIRIRESDRNLLSIKGSMHPIKNGFSADLRIGLKDQFAIGVSGAASEVSRNTMNEFVIRFLKSTLHPSVMIGKVDWRNDDSTFSIEAACTFPNSSVAVGTATYSSLSKLFPALFPSSIRIRGKETFYFPYYNRVLIDLIVEKPDSAGAAGGRFAWRYAYAIDPGPFSDPLPQTFVESFTAIQKEFNKNIKIND